jgi:uncharacterized RDD family membrane protein YckC
MTKTDKHTAAALQPSPTIPTGLTAGLGRRLASLLYESLLVTAILIFGWIFPHILLAATAQAKAPNLFVQLHLFLLLLAYFGWCWVKGGQTLAMKTWKIRLISAAGGRVRPGQATVRYMAAWFSLGLSGAGLLWALVDRDGQFLHDRIAGTRLVRDT